MSTAGQGRRRRGGDREEGRWNWHGGVAPSGEREGRVKFGQVHADHGQQVARDLGVAHGDGLEPLSIRLDAVDHMKLVKLGESSVVYSLRAVGIGS